jgi:uncharacterized membrane protein YfcA
MPLIAAVALGAVLGGFVQGLSGFAFGLVAIGLWAWTVDPTVVGPLVVFGSLLGQMLSFGTVRRGLDPGRLLPFIVGGLIGIPIGVLLLRRVDPVEFKLAVGVILLLWCPAMLLLRELPRVDGGGRWADGIAGWIGGVMGGLGGLTGPAPTLWCALRGWGRDEQRAVFQSFNIVMQAATMAAYLATGTINTQTAWLFAIVAPAMLVPTLLGARLYRRFSDAGFQRLVLLLLTASGALLVVSAALRLTR